jgi:tripartite-type tricarboxylate transporter receptor subunit TctC
MGGRVELIISTLASALPHVKAQRLRTLAVTTAGRSRFFPELPTMDEAGVKGYEFSTWYAIVAPTGTPAPVIRRINAELGQVPASATVQQQFAAQGLEATPSTPGQLGAHLRSEVAKWGQVIRASGAKPN